MPLVDWSVQFARALVEFPTIDERLFVYKDSDKADLNKGRTAEKFVGVLGMSEPTAIAAACAITCASRELSCILRHDAPREDDNSVMIHEVVERFHYGPVRAALAVKTSGTSRFRAYLCYKGETKGQRCKSQDLGMDARNLAELRLMAVGGWSDKNETNKRNSASSTQYPNKDPAGPISADQTKPSSRNLGSFLVPKTYKDPRLAQGSSGEKRPACASEHDPPDGEYLAHATDMNSLISIFKTGLCPGSLQQEKSKHLADLRPSDEGAGKRTTVQFAAISNSKRKFMVREKKPLLIVYSATAIAANFETWVFDDDPIVATPNMIRSDLILAVLAANNVIYEDEACPPFVVKNIAFWWDGYLKQKHIKTYSDGQAAAASFNAQGIFMLQPAPVVVKQTRTRNLLHICVENKSAEWKALHDPDSLEAQLAGTSGTSCTTTYTVDAPPPPPSHPPPDGDRQFPPPPSPEPIPMEVDQAQPASSAALPAETPKEEKESELSDKEEEEKDKKDDDNSDLSSLGDDIPPEPEDQDTDEERDVANRLIKHKSVNAGEEKVLVKDDEG